MKSVFVASFGSDAGGIEKSLINFLSFIGSFSKVDLFLWRPPGILFDSMNKITSIISPKVYPGDMREALSYRFPIGLIWYICFRLLRLLHLDILSFKAISQSYDIAISYCQNGYSPYYVIEKVKATKKILWYHHGSYEKQGRAKQRDLSYYIKYDTIVTVSEANKTMLISHFPELEKKIIVIKNLIDREDIVRKSQLKSDTAKVANACNIVTVARIAPEKGQTFALKVAKILKERGFAFHWIFVGDGPDKVLCLSQVKEYNIESSCSFVGAKNNPYPYIDKADIYVQTSSIEADPITIAEAKVLRKPIIASDIPPIREALGNGQFGTLCSLNPQTFADRIIDTFNNKNGHTTAGTSFYDSATDNAQQLVLIHNLLNQ